MILAHEIVRAERACGRRLVKQRRAHNKQHQHTGALRGIGKDIRSALAVSRPLFRTAASQAKNAAESINY